MGYMCPHCGCVFSDHCELIPTHDYPKPCRSVCPGSGQHPRNPETDRRPLWKDQAPVVADVIQVDADGFPVAASLGVTPEGQT